MYILEDFLNTQGKDSVTSGPCQGRNEVYGIRDQRPKKGWDQGSQPRIRDQSPRDRDQRVFHGLKDQASR